MTGMFSTELAIQLAVAAGLGGILGLEREIHGRPAGLRTHLLVSLGATVFMVLSPFVAGMNESLPGDPGRIAAQIVTGIGFLGAGAILKEGVTIHGLTTAASLWIAAAIGMATGAGCYLAAVLTTALAMCTLAMLPLLEKLLKRHSDWVVEVTTPLDANADSIIAAVRSQKVRILRCEMALDYDEGVRTTTLVVRLFHRDITNTAASRVAEAIGGIGVSPRRITWRAE